MTQTSIISDVEGTLSTAVSKRKQDVIFLLNEGQSIQSLQIALSSPPVESRVQSTKDANSDIVRSVLMAIPEKNIDEAIKSLSLEDCDILMKFLYKLLASKAGTGSGTLLKWHGKLVPKTGAGSIVRVLTDQKVV
mmetsp:Transcript_28400/g.41872  ORF Transcript_28400/g.41872 Transcript_28400/m.41872 type:complete len:135 (+) Transcript_28400:182-586(+)